MLAAITFVQIVELLVLFIVLNVVITAPFVLAGFLAYLEYQENRRNNAAR